MIFSPESPTKPPPSLYKALILLSRAHPSIPAKEPQKTHHTSIILKVQEHSIRPSPRLALAHNNRRHDLLPQLRLALLDCSHDHVAHATGWETVEARADTFDGDDVEVSGTGVVAAVHHCAAGGLLASARGQYWDIWR
jgi:hypothetical protein